MSAERLVARARVAAHVETREPRGGDTLRRIVDDWRVARLRRETCSSP